MGIVTLGATLQGGVGFGLGLLSVPLLVNIDPDFVPGPLILAAILLTILITIRERKSIELKGIKWAILGRFFGSIIGGSILTFFPKQHLSVIMGGFVLLAVVLSASGLHLPVTRRSQLGAGTLSGTLATVAAIGGPPLALVYQHFEGARLRGMLSGIFLVGTTFALITLIVVGRFGLRELILALLLFPGVFLGFLLSNYFRRVLDRGFIRQAILIVSAISALVVILRNLL